MLLLVIFCFYQVDITDILTSNFTDRWKQLQDRSEASAQHNVTCFRDCVCGQDTITSDVEYVAVPNALVDNWKEVASLSSWKAFSPELFQCFSETARDKLSTPIVVNAEPYINIRHSTEHKVEIEKSLSFVDLERASYKLMRREIYDGLKNQYGLNADVCVVGDVKRNEFHSKSFCSQCIGNDEDGDALEDTQENTVRTAEEPRKSTRLRLKKNTTSFRPVSSPTSQNRQISATLTQAELTHAGVSCFSQDHMVESTEMQEMQIVSPSASFCSPPSRYSKHVVLSSMFDKGNSSEVVCNSQELVRSCESACEAVKHDKRSMFCFYNQRGGIFLPSILEGGSDMRDAWWVPLPLPNPQRNYCFMNSIFQLFFSQPLIRDKVLSNSSCDEAENDVEEQMKSLCKDVFALMAFCKDDNDDSLSSFLLYYQRAIYKLAFNKSKKDTKLLHIADIQSHMEFLTKVYLFFITLFVHYILITC